MTTALALHVDAHCIVLADMPSRCTAACRRACSACAFVQHFALYITLHFYVPVAALLAADSLRIAVQPIVLSGVLPQRHGPCRRARRARAFARHTAQHPALPSHVQASCLERTRPAALIMRARAFPGALAAGAASAPGQHCRERMREAGVQGKIEGRGTTVRARPVCTWVLDGTRPRAGACRWWSQCLIGLGPAVCRVRLGATCLAGGAP